MLPASELLTHPSLNEADFAPIFPAALAAGESSGFSLHRAGGLLLGQAIRHPGQSLEFCSREIYRQLFAATEGWHLYRIWNQVPHINGAGPGGLENYRAFSAGRSIAFEERFGQTFTGQLPAASGVGTRSPELTVAFVAGRSAPRHFENPAQIPAYRYPAEHGPRPPSFARATTAESGGKPLIFLSGTAAIKGHRTLSPFTLPGQLAATLENLALIGEACGLGRELGAGGSWNRFFKIYYRAAGDRTEIARSLEAKLLRPGDDVVWREADLCRSDLLVEVEASVVGV